MRAAVLRMVKMKRKRLMYDTIHRYHVSRVEGEIKANQARGSERK
jgi:hypothetical protein